MANQEVDALNQIRKRVVDEGLFHPDHVMEDKHLLRFLRARQFDVEKAFKMLSNDLDWRKEFEGRLIMGDEAPSIVEFCRNGFLYRAGRDKDGRPVSFITYKKNKIFVQLTMDVTQVLVLKFSLAFPRQIKDTKEIVLFWVAYVHLLTTECEKFGVTDYTVIADLEGFSPSKNFSLAIVKLLIGILQNNYPERLAYALVLNLPAAFRMGWNMILPFLDERTKAKIHILGPNLKLLQEYIPVSDLETSYGGKHSPYPKPDALTLEIVNQGILIKTGYFDTSPSVNGDAAKNGRPTSLDNSHTRTLSSSRFDRFRQLLTRSPSSAGLISQEDGPKAIDVPKGSPRVTVFGATGRTGIEVVKRLLKADFDVSVFIRLQGNGAPPTLLKLYQEYSPKDKFQIVVGDLTNPNDLDRAIETSDAVISCIGATRAMAADTNEFFESTGRSIVDSMIRNGTRRFVIVTAGQARRMSTAWWDSNGSITENSIRHLYWGGHYKHLAELEKFVESQKKRIDYTFVRPSQLDDNSSSEAFKIQPNEFFISGASLPRPALAKFIVNECILHQKYVGSGVAIAGSD